MRMQDATAGFVTIPAPAQDRDVLPQEAGAAVIRALLDAICDQARAAARIATSACWIEQSSCRSCFAKRVLATVAAADGRHG